MRRTFFQRVVAATKRNYHIEKSISGYYRLLLDDEIVFDDSACEDLNEDYNTAEDYFANYLLEYAVPESCKEMRHGMLVLKRYEKLISDKDIKALIKEIKENGWQNQPSDEDILVWVDNKDVDKAIELGKKYKCIVDKMPANGTLTLVGINFYRLI